MKVEFDLQRKEELPWLAGLALLVLAALVCLSLLGESVGGSTSSLLTWTEWRMTQAQREHVREIGILRTDALQLAQTLERKPDPVKTLMLQNSINKHTKTGIPSLDGARNLLQAAARDVLDWSTGSLSREQASQSLIDAMKVLQP